jgi:hypothetical protein
VLRAKGRAYDEVEARAERLVRTLTLQTVQRQSLAAADW